MSPTDRTPCSSHRPSDRDNVVVRQEGRGHRHSEQHYREESGTDSSQSIDHRISRRTMLAGTLGAAITTRMGEMSASASKPWQIGCFNRPWYRWSLDQALDGMKAAGFKQIGFLGGHTGEPLISADASPSYLQELKKRIAQRGLTANSAWMKTEHDISMTAAMDDARKQIDNAARLKLRYVMAIGPDPPELYEHFYLLMKDAAEYASHQSIQVMFKPHGGVAAASEEILRCIDRVGHPNFRHWYDAGNIIHYTGRDPVAEAERVSKVVTGFCAKDCAQKGGEVMIQFGAGQVNFTGVLSTLAKTGFRGPVMVECCAGQTPDEVTENVRRNREFLEHTVASI